MTAYVMFEDLPLDDPRWETFRPQITEDMVIEAACIAYRDGDETGSREIIRAWVGTMKPTSEDAAERITEEIMEVIRTA